jgi:hypothetical protein
MNMQEILQTIASSWPLVTLALAFAGAIIFRKELGKLIGELREFEFDPRNRKFRLVFGQEVKNIKARAKGVEREVALSRTLPAAERVTDFTKQSGRDVVLESWGALKQIVYDASMANKIPLTPTTGIQEAVRRLVEANVVTPELNGIINLLNKLGEQLANNTKLRPAANDAREYKAVIYDVVDWMMLNVLSRPETKEAKPSVVTPRLATIVSDYFPQPQPGRPAAVLDGVGGVARAKRVPIDKEHFRIGRNSDNDLVISGDEFVSGHHAHLRYQKGSLFLADEGSRNGTFLNDKRVTGTAFIVRRGDHIRIGNAVFQVSGAPASQTPNTPNKDKDDKRSFVG